MSERRDKIRELVERRLMDRLSDPDLCDDKWIGAALRYLADTRKEDKDNEEASPGAVATQNQEQIAASLPFKAAGS